MVLQTCVSLVTGVALANPPVLWRLVRIPAGRKRHRRQHSETCHSLHQQRVSEIEGRALAQREPVINTSARGGESLDERLN